MFYSVMIFLFLVLSGDCVGALCGKKFGEVTPITMLSIGLFLYCFGLVEQLYLGLIVVFAVTGMIYIWCLGKIIIKRQWKLFLSGFFTKSFVLFAIICVIILWGDYKQQGTSADDLGHWMDCVKSMVWSEKFYTANTFSISTHSTYPPFVAMIQYAVQAGLIRFFGGQFSEWLLLYVYHSFIIILCLPILSYIEQETHKWISTAAVILAVAVMPTVFFPLIYYNTYVDPLLAVAAAILFVSVNSTWKNKSNEIYVALLLPSLVLMKDLGLFFSAFGMVFLAYRTIKEKKIGLLAASVSGVAFAKISWMLIIRRYNAIDIKPDHVDWIQYIKAFCGLSEYSEVYKNITLQRYRTTLFDKRFRIGESLVNVSMPYILCIIVLLLLFLLLARFILRKEQENSLVSFGYLKANGIIMTCMILAFWFGMGGVYVDKFIYTEAVELASFERYCNTVLAVIFFEMIILLLLNHPIWKIQKAIILLPIFIILISSSDGGLDYLQRNFYQKEYNEREQANLFSEAMTETCEKGSSIYLISQSGSGWRDYLVGKFMIRPDLALQSIAGNDYNWRLVKERNPDDIYSKEMNKVDFEKEIFDSGKYQYVAVARADDYLNEEFSTMFGVDNINDKTIFKVDETNRRLVLIYGDH